MKPDPTYTYYGRTKGGKILLPSNKIRKEIGMGLPDAEIEVTFRRKRKRRSVEENNYYWGCIVAAFLEAFRDFDPEMGWTPEMVHEELKRRFLGRVKEWGRTVLPTGEAIDEPMSTTKLSTIEAEMYYEHCRKWGAEELDIMIALPNEQMSIFQIEEQ
jgi:hypothetical protein